MKVMFARWSVQFGALLLLAAALGCSKGSGSFATVSGVVTQNGAPLEQAKVTFHSTVASEGTRGTVCSAQTDSSGKYLIAMVGKDPGIPPGLYKVTVTKLEAAGGGTLPPDFDQGQLEASGMAVNKLPKSYENPTTTKLSATLEPGKNQNVNFDLKGK